VPGVLRVVVGYTGGTTEWPTYSSIGDHTEAVQILFDESKVSHEELLDRFWQAHDPRSKRYGKQYQNACWYRTAEEEERIRASGRKVVSDEAMGTLIAPLGPFYLAEGYHQKYLDRSLLNSDPWLLQHS